MKYKATVSFAGQVCMAAGEVQELPVEIAAPLLSCGYLVEEKTAQPPAKTTRKK